MPVRSFSALLILLAACTTEASFGPDAGDSTTDGDTKSDDGSSNSDASTELTWPSCGTATFDHFELYYGKAIAVANDGTVYHAMNDGGENYVSRYRPGQPIEREWHHVGTAASGVTALTVSPAGVPYALLSLPNDRTQLVRLGATVEWVGTSLQATSGPMNLTFSPDGILFEASFTGLRRVDTSTGVRTPVSDPVMLREVYFIGPRKARGVSYDHGLVELTLNAAATSSTFESIYPFETVALQYTGMDQQGRTLAIIHEMSNDKLVRFDPTFATRETLLMYPSVSFVFGKIAFGRGALRCDVMVTGYNVARIATNDTPGVP